MVKLPQRSYAHKTVGTLLQHLIHVLLLWVAPTNVTCPPLSLNLNNTLTPRSNYAVLNTTQTRGTLVAQICNSGFVLSQSRSPINVYVCQSTGNWTSNISDNNCVAGP
ncbi:hypothetical protein M3Y98_00724500 [Aphelenchoides besseyi]|nr:hypothetical protein M3Y98_00724500 [Aphelenchoides besseyi]